MITLESFESQGKQLHFSRVRPAGFEQMVDIVSTLVSNL